MCILFEERRGLSGEENAPAESWKYKRNSYYHSNAHSVGESEVLLFEGLLRFPGDKATAHTQQRFGLSGEVYMTSCSLVDDTKGLFCL